MASRPLGGTIRRIEQLFQLGSVAGLSEVQLLERFVRGQDDAAFEALLERHGPMVLGLCRQWLRDPADVEDAFQATFLVLVRKAGSLRNRELLGNWLYGVAYRVALRARADRARRRSRESTGVVERAAPRDPEIDEPRTWLHEEVSRLPEKYRAPIVLCYLEGRTHEEAAEQLRWPVGTVKGRLSRARALLHLRLSRRGLAPAFGLLATNLARESSAAVPPALIAATVRAASGLAANNSAAAGLISVQVLTLLEGVCHTMFLSKLKFMTLSFAIAGVVTTSAAVLARQTPGNNAEPAEPPAPKAGSSKPSAPGSASRSEGLAQPSFSPPATTTPRDEPNSEPQIDPQGRVTLARRAMEVLRKLRESGREYDPKKEYEWSIRLLEAERAASDKKTDRVTAAVAHMERMKGAMDRMREMNSRGTHSTLDLLEAQFRYQQAEQSLVDARAEKAGQPRTQAKAVSTVAVAGVGMSGGGFGGGGESSADLDRRRGAIAMSRQMIAMSRRMIAEKAPLAAAGDSSPRTKEILKKLETPISMSFADEALLEDVLRYIKQATTGPDDTGIPIYVDPVGLKEAERTMTAPVSLDLEGVPLKTTLRLLLKQVDLAYCVKDGLLIISSVDGILQELEEAEANQQAEAATAR